MYPRTAWAEVVEGRADTRVPLSSGVREFIDAHDSVFVVEQNHDAQLRSLLAIETGVPRADMTPVFDYGGMTSITKPPLRHPGL